MQDIFRTDFTHSMQSNSFQLKNNNNIGKLKSPELLTFIYLSK